MVNNILTTVDQRLINGYATVEYLLMNIYPSVDKRLSNGQSFIFTSRKQRLANGWSWVVELSKKSLPMHIHIHRHMDIDNSRRGNTSVAFRKK